MVFTIPVDEYEDEGTPKAYELDGKEVAEEIYMDHILEALTAVCEKTVSYQAPRNVHVDADKPIGARDRLLCVYTSIVGCEGTPARAEEDQTTSTTNLRRLAEAEAEEIVAARKACKGSATYLEPALSDFFRDARTGLLMCKYQHWNRTTEKGGEKVCYEECAVDVRSAALMQAALIEQVGMACDGCISWRRPRPQNFFAAAPDKALRCRYTTVEYNDAGQAATLQDYYLSADQLRRWAEQESEQVKSSLAASKLLAKSSPFYCAPKKSDCFKPDGGELSVLYDYKEEGAVMSLQMEAGPLIEWAQRQHGMSRARAMARTTPW